MREAWARIGEGEGVAKFQVKVDYMEEKVFLVNKKDGSSRELDPSRWGELLERLGQRSALENIRSGEGASAFGKIFRKARERHHTLSFLNWEMDPKKMSFEDDGSIFGDGPEKRAAKSPRMKA